MKVALIGSGNVATHIAKAFKESGHQILQVCSPNIDHARELAEQVNADIIPHVSALTSLVDLIVIAVKDDAITEVATQLKDRDSIVVHTSGATDMEVLSHLKRYGVLYPLQTFTKTNDLDFSQVPLCIEAGDPESYQILKDVSTSLSTMVYAVNTMQRKILHLSAAFACNFVNQLYTLSNNLLLQNNLDFNLLRPLIKETAEKVQRVLPLEAQTGPAIRSDEGTLEAHLQLLQHMPELQHIYQTLSDSIKKSHQ
jgi:predicted short-subunit dehydrogenase-like oxidoreductase (DUF2520 family)